jgi:GT2 family glycosyltransferase
MANPSIVIASFRESALLDACLTAALAEARTLGAEVVVARAHADAAVVAERYPGVRVVAVNPGAPLPEVRGRGVAAASGDPVALTEDHCVPAPGWLAALAAARQRGADVAGGGMAHSPTSRVLDWGAYFSEYGFFSFARPATTGVPLITGANVAYGRAWVAEIAQWMIEGAWENVVHDRLAARQARFEFVPAAQVRHQHRYRFAAFCRDRFEHGRDYARDRLQERGSNRWVRALLTPALAPVLFRRVMVASAGESPAAFWKASPFTFAFLSAWAAGEAAGNLLGVRESSPRP